MSTDLGLDPSDPLNLLLHNKSQAEDSTMESSSSVNNDGEGAPDWSQLSSLWDGSESLAKYPDLMDFHNIGALPMDMDFSPASVIDPNYDPLKFNPSIPFPYDDVSSLHNIQGELMPSAFPFSFQSLLNSSASSFSSDASSISSPESPSLSPMPESIPSPAPGYISETASPLVHSAKVEERKIELNPQASDAVADIAQRVREAAGVMLAVPMSSQLPTQVLAQTFSAGPIATPNQGKLPIPRLPRPAASPKSPISSSSSAASTPPPATPPHSTMPAKLIINAKPMSSSSSPSSSTLATPVNTVSPSVSASTSLSSTGTSGRPKTSHTTIERRYRTNLNARIQSLRMAVPALRVLEDRDGGNGKKIKKNLKDGVYLKGAGIGIDTEDGTTVDVIDERGFVDGVKVARKCSKANVLGKAVEYIRVLKKRENRLKAEQNGLKALVCGLVGGPALLKEWEQRWRERFGGEEKDEVEGEEVEEDDSDDEDGEEGEEEVGKKRKRVKVSAPVKKPTEKKPTVVNVITELGGTAPGATAAPEKRKRGRPRKVVPPPAPVATLAPQVPVQPSIAPQDTIMLPPDAVQPSQPPAQQYLMAVFAIFSFFNSPFSSSHHAPHSNGHQHAGVVLTPPLALAPEIVAQFSPPAPVQSGLHSYGIGWSLREYAQFLHILVSALLIGTFLYNWVGAAFRRKSKGPRSSASTDWATVCDDSVLSGNSGSLSIASKLRMYYSLSTQKNSSVSQLGTLALSVYNMGGVLNSLMRSKARSIWNAAKARSELPNLKPGVIAPVKISEKLVLDSFTVDEAVECLAGTSAVSSTPMHILASSVVVRRMKQHLGQLFVEAVGVCDIEDRDRDTAKQQEAEMRRTIDAARELGGSIEELGRLLERTWKSSTDIPSLDVVEESSGDDGELIALFTALVLHRRLFQGTPRPAATSFLLSPPPSPTSPASRSRTTKEGEDLLVLRKALGNRIFEDGDRDGDMEDARDRVVDLIVEMERRGRSISP